MSPLDELLPYWNIPVRFRRLGLGRRHGAAVAAVVLTHCVLFLILRWSFGPTVMPSTVGELRVSFFKIAQNRPLAVNAVPPNFPAVQVPVVPVPDQPAVAATAPASSVLAPRPNPAEPNARPSAAASGPGAVEGMSMTLKVLVLPDGTIGDVTIVKSSGQSEVDAAMVEYVKAHWHFLPATLDGVAIQYWTSLAIELGR
jgi:TonB family protein